MVRESVIDTRRVLSPVRAAVGVARLAVPDIVIPGFVGGPRDTAGRRVVRVLGARQLTQALLTGRNATPAVLLLGVEVDLAHAVSMIGLAIVAPRYRRAALADAAVATMLAAAGISAANAVTTNPIHNSGFAARRDRWAARLAGRLVPGFAATSRDEPGTRK